MSSKIDRAHNGPSWTEVTIGALLSVVVGAMLAAAWLVLKPVETVRELPKEPTKGVVYYIEGSANSTQGRLWQRKQQAFMAGQTVSLNEQELNSAVKTLTAESAKAAPADSAQPDMITAGTVNFRIADGLLQMAAPVDLNIYGLFQSKVQIIAQGTFERSGEKYAFSPTKLYVGSCRVDRLPVVGGLILNKLWAAAALPEALTSAWAGLANVTIEGSQLQLVMP
jgi:hypothetical protein